jgi:hypothetical protein
VNRARKVRMAFIFRWLGRRTDAFCMDYTGLRQGGEAHPNPNGITETTFPRSMDCREMFWITRKKDKAPHPVQEVVANPQANQKKARKSIRGNSAKAALLVQQAALLVQQAAGNPQIYQKKTRQSEKKKLAPKWPVTQKKKVVLKECALEKKSPPILRLQQASKQTKKGPVVWKKKKLVGQRQSERIRMTVATWVEGVNNRK